MRDAGADGSMKPTMTNEILRLERASFLGTGGKSAGNWSDGFWPAFLDTANRTYLFRFSDGHPAPFHLLDGLPDENVLRRNASGRVEAAKHAVVSGFVRARRFYRREEAAQAVAAKH